MNTPLRIAAALACTFHAAGFAQTPQGQEPPPPREERRGPGGFGGPGGPMGGSERKVLKQFDKDENKRLNAAERAEARAWLKENT